MNNNKLRGVVAALIASAGASAALAQSADASSDPQNSEDEVVALDAFTVDANPDNGYKATNVLSGTRFNTPILDLPKSIDVVTREFMLDIGATDIAEALEYVPGVAVDREDGHAGKTDSDVLIRGFAGGGGGVSSGGGNQYINGYRTFGNFDNIAIERIEILKGPSSLFSGAIGAGGAINTVVRQPTKKTQGSMMLSYGSWDSSRAELDQSGPLGANGKSGYWVGAAIQDYGKHFDYYEYKRSTISGTFAWQPTDSTRVTFFSQYLHNEQVPAGHQILWNPARTENINDAPRTFNRMGPDAFNDSQQSHTIVDVVHALGDNWSLKVGGIYRTIDGQRNLVTGSTNIRITSTGVRDVTRTASAILTEEEGYAAQAYLLGKMEYANLTHSMIFGYEIFSQTSIEDVRRKSPGLSRIDIDNPDYILGELGDPWDLSQYPRLNGRYRQLNLETYAFTMNNLWQTAHKGLTVQLGYRYDDSSEWYDDLVDPTASFTGSAKPASLLNGGVAVRILPRTSLFASFNESYEPLVKSDYEGKPFDPREGKGVDVGLRYDQPDGRVSATMTAFKATNKNLEQSDPDHPGYQVQSGENETQGVEFGLFARPMKQWMVVGAYTYTDSKVVSDIARPFNEGLALANVPRHSVSLWNRYRFDDGALKGLGLGAGMVYVGDRRGHPNLQDLPGLRSPQYYTLQLTASYGTKLFGKRTSFSLSVKNVLDEDYRPSYRGFGPPRSFTGKMVMSF